MVGSPAKAVGVSVDAVDKSCCWIDHQFGQTYALSKMVHRRQSDDILTVNYLLTVFAEKGVLENQSSPYTSDILSDDCVMHGTSFDVNTKKVLIASRHMRNDSKGIQLEIR